MASLDVEFFSRKLYAFVGTQIVNGFSEQEFFLPCLNWLFLTTNSLSANQSIHKLTVYVISLPLGPTLDNAFLCYYEKVWIDECPSQSKPVYYRRYVNDTFVLFRSAEHVALFNSYVNIKDRNIKFTSESENLSKLNLLN